VDIYENENELLLVADLPGVGRDALNLAIEPPELRLETTPQSETEASFTRSFTIDERIAAAEVSAELEGGVLKVRLPKAPSLRPRQIPIRASS
jgi:HSP20 family molecular chaperone IbpA